MKFNYVQIIIIAIILFFSTYSIFSQDINENQIKDVLGIWENDSKIVSIESNDEGIVSTNIVLKTFYGFYYDGTYPLYTGIDINLARLGDNLYMEYWLPFDAYSSLGEKSLTDEIEEENVFKVTIDSPKSFDIETASVAEGTLWLPQSNIQELSIDDTILKDEILGYYINDDSVYEIRYWLTDVTFQNEKAELTLIGSDEKKSVYVHKHIQIGQSVYTCATGLRTKIRNVKKIESLDGNSIFSEGDTLLVFGEPYLYLSKITNIDEAIAAHNSIIRPPRDGRATFVEPSIYKKLEQMTIEDFDDPYAPIH